MRARVLSESLSGGPAALLESFPATEKNDPVLDGWAAKLQEPVTFHDTVLGTFTLDRRASRYTAAVRWRGQPIELHLATVSPISCKGPWQQRMRSGRSRRAGQSTCRSSPRGSSWISRTRAGPTRTRMGMMLLFPRPSSRAAWPSSRSSFEVTVLWSSGTRMATLLRTRNPGASQSSPRAHRRQHLRVTHERPRFPAAGPRRGEPQPFGCSDARSLSGARKRPRRSSGGKTASIASSFSVGSARRYVSVGSMRAWPSHRATF